ncbi:hypothetical protein [Hoeflea sp.]|uniref:hypothetical protein n=1 Tax=Hoeflea sp. TaxID=1940281 RepID=UPI002AFFF859|nr:hypothetical protein [Hoeflea sp.]
MTYVNYDLEAVEKTMRAMFEETFMERLSAAATADEKICYIAQQRFTEAQISSQIEMLRMLNENRDAAFIGRTIGAFIGNTLVNTLSASQDPAVCLAQIDQVISNSIAAVYAEPAAGVVWASRLINGTLGGRP